MSSAEKKGKDATIPEVVVPFIPDKKTWENKPRVEYTCSRCKRGKTLETWIYPEYLSCANCDVKIRGFVRLPVES